MATTGHGEAADKNSFIKVPPTRQNVLFAVVLAAGLALLVTGLIILARNTLAATRLTSATVLLILGAVATFLALAVTRSSVLLFAGASILLNGILALLCAGGKIPFSLKQLWPLCVVIEGLSLQVASMYHTQRVRSVYLFPSIMLVILGACFLPFSLKVVAVPLVHVILAWWPLILVLCGIVLIAIFLFQQLHHKDFPYMEDDSLVEGGDD